jgi:hypothetical protein
VYDAQIGRWHVLDPKGTKYAFSSPYVYVLNRPTIAIDPDGKDIIIVTKSGNVTLTKNILLKTELGKQLWNKYANSKTHDVYLISSKGLLNDGNAGGQTIPWDRSSLYIDVRTNKKTNKVESFFNINSVGTDEEKKDFSMINGRAVKNDNRKNSVIAISEEAISLLGEYAMAEVLYHELYAHVEKRKDGSTAEEDHEEYGIEEATEGEPGDFYYIRNSQADKIWQQIVAAAKRAQEYEKAKERDKLFKQMLKEKKEQ